MNADRVVIGAGALAFAGSFKDANGFPPNGYKILAATITLAFLFAMTKGTAIEKPTKALALLTLLGAAYRYIPAFTPKKRKTNG